MEKLISVRDLFKKRFDLYVEKFWTFINLLFVPALMLLFAIPVELNSKKIKKINNSRY